MAVDKLVDSTQLDTDLTSVADAIRTKGGTSASLAFPSGFVSAINAIPSVGSATISATSPINVSTTVASNLMTFAQYGECIQSVTPRKNLLNTKTNVEAAYITASGVITQQTTYRTWQYTDLIPVIAGDAYTWSLKSHRTSSATNRWHGYDASGNWVRQISYAGVDAGNTSMTLTAIIPDDVTFVRLSYGLYDSDAMFENGAVKTAYEPYTEYADIVCNNGVLQSGIPITLPMDRIFAYIDASGAWRSASDSYSICVEVEIGKTYAIRWTDTNSADVSSIFRYGFSDTSTVNGQILTQFNRTSPQSVPYVELTADQQYLVIQISSSYGADIIANGYITMEESYLHIEGTPEVLTVSDGVTTQTATIAPLLSVGNYRDEQDIINGVVTRRVTYCIYDGTQIIGDIYMSSTGGKDIGAVIVYPLAAATTETVTAQPFHLSAGENSIDVTSAIGQAEFKVKLL